MERVPPAIGPLLLLALLLGSLPARAEVPTAPPPAPAAPVTSPPMIWYGWETLGAGASVSALTLAVLKDDPLIGLVLGAALSPLATMSLHLVHGDEVKAFVSLPLSYAMIAGGGALAAKIGCGPSAERRCDTDVIFTGMILGGAAAVVLDAAALAWGKPALPPKVKKAVLLPLVVPLPGGASVGLGGVF